MSNHVLEKMYDQMLPGWNDAEEDDKPRWRIVAKYDAKRRCAEGVTLSGAPFLCHICHSEEDWIMESRSFVCVHEPIHGAGFAIRQISSVPFGLVDSEKIERV